MIGLGGIGVYLDNLLEYWIYNRKENSYLLIGDESELLAFNKYSNCKVINTEIRIFSLKELVCFPVKEINKCDVFYTPNYNIPLGIKIPIFSTIHDVVFLDVKGLTSIFGKLVRWLALKRAIKISAKIFTVSNFSKERIVFHFREKKEILITYNSIRPDLVRFPIPKQSPFEFSYILFVGNIKKHKGIANLLTAYNQALKNGFNLKLVIVGNMNNFKTSDKTISRFLKVIDNNNIVFTGKISDEQLFKIMAHAALLVQPSTYEGFGIPPLEALYLGCNVLVSDIPVFNELYKGLPVIFFKSGDIEDLRNKIMFYSGVKALGPNIDVRNKINELFNLEVTARLIFDSFESIVGCIL